LEIIVSGYGVPVDSSIAITDGTAKFTLQSGRDRFFVSVAGYEQCKTIIEASKRGATVFVIGKLFSFVHNGCRQHHVGIDAAIVLTSGASPTETAMIGLIERQIISKQMRNGNGNGKTTVLA